MAVRYQRREHEEHIQQFWRDFFAIKEIVSGYFEACKKATDPRYIPAVPERLSDCPSGSVRFRARYYLQLIASFYQNPVLPEEKRQQLIDNLLEHSVTAEPLRMYLDWLLMVGEDVAYSDLFIKNTPVQFHQRYIEEYLADDF